MYIIISFLLACTDTKSEQPKTTVDQKQEQTQATEETKTTKGKPDEKTKVDPKSQTVESQNPEVKEYVEKALNTSESE